MNFPTVTSRRMAGVVTPGLPCTVGNERPNLAAESLGFT